MKEFLKTLFPIFYSLIKSPIFCRHNMKYYDMKWYVDDENNFLYKKFNGRVVKNVLCHCQKCDVKYKKSLSVGDYGKWKRFDFNPTNNSYIEVELHEVGKETKSQKRDRLINEIL